MVFVLFFFPFGTLFYGIMAEKYKCDPKSFEMSKLDFS